VRWYERHLAERAGDAGNRDALMQASPPSLEYLGLERSWRELGDAHSAA
jgi:hypothetical protein